MAKKWNFLMSPCITKQSAKSGKIGKPAVSIPDSALRSDSRSIHLVELAIFFLYLMWATWLEHPDHID